MLPSSRLPFPDVARSAAAPVLLLLTLSFGMPAVGADLPAGVLSRLPAEAHLLVVFSSLDGASEAWGAWRSADGDASDPAAGGAPGPLGLVPVPKARTPHDLVAGLAPGLEDQVDPARPIAIALVLPEPMAGGGGEPVVALPLRDRKPDLLKLKERAGGAAVFVQDGYAIVTRDSTYTPGTTGPALATGLPAGVIAARVDLAGIIARYRPLVEMLLPMLSEPGAFGAADSTGAGAPALPPELAPAIVDLVTGFFDAAQRLDFSLEAESGRQRLATTFVAAPGSALDPGPQPDLAPALALARHLPAGYAVQQAYAMDLTRLAAFLGPWQHVVATLQASPLPEAVREGYVRYVDESMALASMPLTCASALTIADGHLRSQMLLGVDDPAAFVERGVALYRQLGELGLGFALAEGAAETVEGVVVRNFELTMNADALESLPATPAVGQMQAMTRLMLALNPVIRVASLPGVVVVCSDDDPQALPALLARVRGGAGEVPPALAAAAAAAPPGTQSVLCGDLVSLVGAMLAVAEPSLAMPPSGGPVPFTLTGSVLGGESGLALACDPRALATLGRSVEAFVAAQAGAAGEGEAEATDEDAPVEPEDEAHH